MIRYTVSSILPDGALSVVATVDAPGPADDWPPPRVSRAVNERWPGSWIVSAWIGWSVEIDGRLVGHVDFGPVPGAEDPGQVALFG